MYTEVNPTFKVPSTRITLARMYEHVHVVRTNTGESLLAHTTHVIRTAVDNGKEVLILLV